MKDILFNFKQVHKKDFPGRLRVQIKQLSLHHWVSVTLRYYVLRPAHFLQNRMALAVSLAVWLLIGTLPFLGSTSSSSVVKRTFGQLLCSCLVTV